MLDDPLGLLEERSVLLAYARASLEFDLADTTFLFHHPSQGNMRIWVECPYEVPEPMREITVGLAGRPFGLTNRELDVLTLLAGGLSNRAIADALGTKPKTIDTHLARMLLKLDQSTRGGAAALAVEHGLIKLPLPVWGANALLGLTPGLLHRAATTKGDDATFVAARARLYSRPVVRRRPLQVGCIVPAAGFADSQDMWWGGALAVAELNRGGGARGRLVEQRVVEADVWSHESMKAAIHGLAEEGLDALIFGYALDQPGIAGLLEYAGSYGFPVLHASTSSSAAEAVRENPGQLRSVFQLCGAARLYGEGFLDVITGLRDDSQWSPRSSRVAVLDGYGGNPVLSEEAASRAETMGWDLRLVARPDSKASEDDIDGIIRKIDEIEPSALLLSTFLDEHLLRRILERIALYDQVPLAYALYTPALAGFIDRVGAPAEGLIWATMSGNCSDRIGASFSRSFAATYGRAPGVSQAGINYDAVSLLAHAWERSSHPRHMDEVNTALREVIYRGVNGVYWFGTPSQGALSYPAESEDPSVAMAHLVFQIQDSQHRLVAPSPYADANFRLPG